MNVPSRLHIGHAGMATAAALDFVARKTPHKTQTNAQNYNP